MAHAEAEADADPTNAQHVLELLSLEEEEGDLELALGHREDAIREYRSMLALR